MRNQIISPKRLFLRVTHYSIDDIDERQIQRRVTYFADKIFYRCRQRAEVKKRSFGERNSYPIEQRGQGLIIRAKHS